MKLRKEPTAVLGLVIDGRKISGGLVRKCRGGVKLERRGEFELSLDPLTEDPDLIGREVRQRLREAGLTERRCVVGVPLDWMLTSLVSLPDLTGENLDGYIRLQVEKTFPFLPDDLSVSVSEFKAEGQGRYALLTAVPKKHLDLLERSLRVAGLSPESFSLAIQGLRQKGDGSKANLVSLVVASGRVSVAVHVGGRTVGLRSLNDVFEDEGGTKAWNSVALGREIRVTLGQLPEELRKELKTISIQGTPSLVTGLAEEIRPRAEALGLRVEIVPELNVNGSAVAYPFEGQVPLQLALGAEFLHQRPGRLEYLPPKVTPFEKWVARANSKKSGLLIGVSAVVVVTLIALFAWQAFTLSRLQTRWSEIEGPVTRLESIQERIRSFRSWYETSQPNLRVLKALTTAFPEDGRVTAKTYEFRGRSEVSCSGTASSSAELFGLLDRLRENPNVVDLKTENLRGLRSVEFTFSFNWQEGGRGE